MEKVIYELLLDWYKVNKRDIVFRHDKNPYHIWLSEIMCQQTRIDTVIPYFTRFIQNIPDIKSLASFNDDDLLKLWQGLGYYNRAKNLKKAAIEMVEKYNGQFPRNYDEVRKLPGIGDYTAGAILSIAFDLPFAAVDGNVLRVYTRLYQNDTNILDLNFRKKVKAEIEENMIKESGDFNQAVMDIGATICIPNGQPLCESCPLKDVCLAHQNHKELDYPVKEKAKEKKEENYTALILKQDNKLLLSKRDDKLLLGGMYGLKMIDSFSSIEQIKEKLNLHILSYAGPIEKDFVFTHRIWHMKGYILEVKDYKEENNEVFVLEEELKTHYSIPTAFRQFLEE